MEPPRLLKLIIISRGRTAEPIITISSSSSSHCHEEGPDNRRITEWRAESLRPRTRCISIAVRGRLPDTRGEDDCRTRPTTITRTRTRPVITTLNRPCRMRSGKRCCCGRGVSAKSPPPNRPLWPLPPSGWFKGSMTGGPLESFVETAISTKGSAVDQDIHTNNGNIWTVMKMDEI